MAPSHSRAECDGAEILFRRQPKRSSSLRAFCMEVVLESITLNLTITAYLLPIRIGGKPDFSPAAKPIVLFALAYVAIS